MSTGELPYHARPRGRPLPIGGHFLPENSPEPAMADEPAPEPIPLEDDHPRAGRCSAGHAANAVWMMPDGRALCADHLFQVLQRITWPDAIRKAR